MAAVVRAFWIGTTLFAVAVAAQQPLAGDQPYDPVRDCPFAAPSLEAESWAEVAWACEQAGERPADVDATIARLRRALAAARADASKNGEAARAVPFVLHALDRLGAKLDLAEFDQPKAPQPAQAWLQLLIRAPGADARLFREFRAVEVGTAEWEVLGEALALRHHPAFAAELFGSLQPVLLVVVGPPSFVGTGLGWNAVSRPRGDRFPPALDYGWQRDDRGFLVLRDRRRTTFVEAEPGELQAVSARWRWLAHLIGEADVRSFPGRFTVRRRESQLADLPEVVAATKVRAEATLRAAAATLVERKLIPASWSQRVPAVRVEVQDHRSDAAKTAQPLPKLD